MFGPFETITFQGLEVLHKLQTLDVLKRLREDKRGVTAMEYGLIAALISITIIAAATQIGGSVKGKFETVQNAVK